MRIVSFDLLTSSLIYLRWGGLDRLNICNDVVNTVIPDLIRDSIASNKAGGLRVKPAMTH